MNAVTRDQQNLAIKPLTADHLPQALALSQALNWPYRFEDWAFALSLGVGLAAELDGQLAGTAIWWPYGDDFAAAGMIIVAPFAQRRGIGGMLMDALLEQTAGRRVILNSTEEGRALYEGKGFSVSGGRVHQHQAVLTNAPVVATDGVIRAMAQTDLPMIHGLDKAATGMVRAALLDALFALGTVKVIERNGAICGYGCVRRWGRGMVVGPIIGREETDARALFAALAGDHVGAFVRIDVTSSSGLSPWLESIDLPDVGPVTCMAFGLPPEQGASLRLFALSNQSLG